MTLPDLPDGYYYLSHVEDGVRMIVMETPGKNANHTVGYWNEHSEIMTLTSKQNQRGAALARIQQVADLADLMESRSISTYMEPGSLYEAVSKVRRKNRCGSSSSSVDDEGKEDGED